MLNLSTRGAIVTFGLVALALAGGSAASAANYKLDFGTVNSGGNVQQSVHYSTVSSAVTHGTATRTASSAHYSIQPSAQASPSAVAGVGDWSKY
jgi:hypothetical protein